MILFETENVKFSYEEEKKILYQQWSGFIPLKDFKHNIDKIVKIMTEHKVEYIISDTQNQSLLSKEATDYAAFSMPTLISLGLKKMAIVLPKSIFTELSVKDFTKTAETNAGQNEIIQHFNKVELAKKWLFE